MTCEWSCERYALHIALASSLASVPRKVPSGATCISPPILDMPASERPAPERADTCERAVVTGGVPPERAVVSPVATASLPKLFSIPSVGYAREPTRSGGNGTKKVVSLKRYTLHGLQRGEKIASYT